MLMMCIARAATTQLVLVMCFCDRQYRADADDAHCPGLFAERQSAADDQLMLMMHTTRAGSFQALPN